MAQGNGSLCSYCASSFVQRISHGSRKMADIFLNGQ
jgi:hypothetical protein